jgi:hypothetical protein
MGIERRSTFLPKILIPWGRRLNPNVSTRTVYEAISLISQTQAGKSSCWRLRIPPEGGDQPNHGWVYYLRVCVYELEAVNRLPVQELSIVNVLVHDVSTINVRDFRVYHVDG